jgi:hypothetical protein
MLSIICTLIKSINQYFEIISVKGNYLSVNDIEFGITHGKRGLTGKDSCFLFGEEHGRDIQACSE